MAHHKVVLRKTTAARLYHHWPASCKRRVNVLHFTVQKLLQGWNNRWGRWVQLQGKTGSAAIQSTTLTRYIVSQMCIKACISYISGSNHRAQKHGPVYTVWPRSEEEQRHVDEHVPPLDLVVAERVRRSVLAQEEWYSRTNAAHVKNV